ncbi:MAG: hypothetical protein DRM98_02320 [Thermoplasmata archaeon]|nr:MAG: hypothetical protein DRM98_02320 [Thermoplasmata archaeon]
MSKIKNTLGLYKNQFAVSEVLGTILLLVISVTLFSAVYATVLSITPGPTTPSTSIIGTIEDKNLILEHHGGESLPKDTEVIIGLPNGNVSTESADRHLLDDNNNGKWDIGEKFVYGITDPDFKRFDSVDVSVVDLDSNSLVMMGTLQEARTADLEVTMSVSSPIFGSSYRYIFTITVTNNGPSYAEEIKVKDLLPEGLSYISSSVTKGVYDPDTGIWSIDRIEAGNFEKLTLTAEVTPTGSEFTFTQLGIILDGSKSISDDTWNFVIDGLADAVQYGTIPHNGMVELTIVQIGGECSDADARLEVGPIVLTDDVVSPSSPGTNVVSEIRHIVKMNGHTPLALGFKNIADILYNKGNFNKNYVQVICVITDGFPNSPYLPPPQGSPPSRPDTGTTGGVTAAEAGRYYLLGELEMTADQDEIDSMVIANLDGDNNFSWLRDNIVYPQPGDDNWPPNKPGWARKVSDSDMVNETIGYPFKQKSSGRTNIAEIISSRFIDPNPYNNKASITVVPPTP